MVEIISEKFFYIKNYIVLCLFLLHLSLQYLTNSQFFFHFFLHAKDKLHIGQTFVGRCSFFFIRLLDVQLLRKSFLIACQK